MGCFPSKEHNFERQSDHESSSDDEQAIFGHPEKAGRVGIAPIISSSSNSSSSSPEEDDYPKQQITNPYPLVEKLAVGIQEISEDDSSSCTTNENGTDRHLFGSPDATVTSSCRLSGGDQSMDDVGDESVVDWLAESSTTLFTSTTLGDSFGDEKMQQSYKPALRLESKHPALPEQPFIVTRGSDFKALPTPPTQVNERGDNEKHVVIDTTHIERRHVPLPSNKPSATKGDWLTNRYCVNDYIVLSEIGRGAHSEVRLCKHKTKNELFAVKIMNRKLLQSKIVDIEKEVNIMKRLRHTNILRLYEVLDDPKVNKVYLITEFAQRGDLMNIIKKDATILSDEQLQNITRQVMEGLLYLHQNNIIHNDLKPSNILINCDGSVRIADFGVSGTGRVRLDSAGTPAFMAPEVVTGEPHDGQLADCYALGATIFCIKFGRPPFIGKGGQHNQKLLDLYHQIKHSKLVFPDAVGCGLKDLISRLMLKDPMRRMQLIDALGHPWLLKQ